MPARRDTLTNFVLANMYPPADPGGVPSNGPTVGMQNVDGQVLFVATGALFAGGTLQAKIQTSTAAGGPFADVPGAVFPDMSGAGPMQGLIVDRALLKSFFRVVCNGDPQGNISIIAVAIKKSLT